MKQQGVIVESIREVSSEDPRNPAKNLLKLQAGKKWRVRTVGEKMAYAILQLKQPYVIHGVDIGNEHSAYVQVMVSNTGCKDEDFKELLTTTNLMSSVESKSSTNKNRVRYFSKSQLVQRNIGEKWNLVKVICTQPFNQHVQYGLVFIKFHTEQQTPAGVGSDLMFRKVHTNPCKVPSAPVSERTLRLRSESLESEGGGAVNDVFGVYKPLGEAASTSKSTSLAAVAVAVAAAAAASTSSAVVSDVDRSSVPDRNREELLFGKDSEILCSEKEKRMSKLLEVDKDRRRSELKKLLSDKENEKAQKEKQKADRQRLQQQEKEKEKEKENTNINQSKIAETNSEQPQLRQLKRLNTSQSDNALLSDVKKPKIIANDKKQKDILYKPFNKLLENVHISISGIENPERHLLRQKFTSMGAKYSPDWNDNCTHLICVVANTPKYNLAKGRGKIVTRAWIDKCVELKKYLPWRRYALDATDRSQPESDVEILDESYDPEPKGIAIEELEELPTTSKGRYPTTAAASRTQRRNYNSISSNSDTEEDVGLPKQNNGTMATNNNINPTSTLSLSSNADAATDEEDYLDDKHVQISSSH